ncbi:MAG: hypothetical protein ACOCX4_00555, partial [Planctomycetota bacterium]
ECIAPGYGGFFVGYGSFLGLYKGPANGTGNTRFMPRKVIRRPSEEPLILDIHVFRILSGSVYNPAQTTTPHGSPGDPRGTNQGFADGSVRWFAMSECNQVYKASYPWGRKVLTPFYMPDGSELFTTGFGQKVWHGDSSLWPLFPGPWYGLNAYLGPWPP